MSDLFANGNFCLIGAVHNLIIPLVFDFKSSPFNFSLIPQQLRQFLAVLTENGLYIGQVVNQIIRNLFSYLMNDLFTEIPNKVYSDNQIVSAENLSNTSLKEINNLQTSMLLYNIDLQLLLIKTKFSCYEKIKFDKTTNEYKSLITPTQHLINIIKFGSNILQVNSNLLLQGILQNRYQFKEQEYWISSVIKEQQDIIQDKLKIIVNSLEHTFAIIQKIIFLIIKINNELFTDELSHKTLELCLTFLKIFFRLRFLFQ